MKRNQRMLFLLKAWMYIASCEFDYQGVAGDATPRYSYTDSDRPGKEQNQTDFDEPSYATLEGIVIHRAKINNLMYCVWGRAIGFKTEALLLGAQYNAVRRGQERDNATSQSAIAFGGDLYDSSVTDNPLNSKITRERARKMQTSNGELDDVNLWPNNKPAPGGFPFPEMPTDYETLNQGDQSSDT